MQSSIHNYDWYSSGNSTAEPLDMHHFNFSRWSKFYQGGCTLGIIYNMHINMRICSNSWITVYRQGRKTVVESAVTELWVRLMIRAPATGKKIHVCFHIHLARFPYRWLHQVESGWIMKLFYCCKGMISLGNWKIKNSTSKFYLTWHQSPIH